jgi:hypothetical protein
MLRHYSIGQATRDQCSILSSDFGCDYRVISDNWQSLVADTSDSPPDETILITTGDVAVLDTFDNIIVKMSQQSVDILWNEDQSMAVVYSSTIQSYPKMEGKIIDVLRNISDKTSITDSKGLIFQLINAPDDCRSICNTGDVIFEDKNRPLNKKSFNYPSVFYGRNQKDTDYIFEVIVPYVKNQTIYDYSWLVITPILIVVLILIVMEVK